MSHQVSYSNNDNVLHFVTSGMMNCPEDVSMWEYVQKVAHEHQAKRILIECTAASGRISMTHCFELIEKMTAICRMLACKVALFERHMGEETRELLKFVETATADRGAHFKLFHDLAEAQIWLKK